MNEDFQRDIHSIQNISAVPTILEIVCKATGMRFAAVARVTEERWIACSVLDEIDFGLKPGGELRVETTICHEIRQSREAVVIDNVAEDPSWCKHPTPAMYAFQSYISVPIILEDASFFGTLCAIDPLPHRLNSKQTVGTFQLFADLIAKHVDADRRLAATRDALTNANSLSDLREQFVAILGHDLRTPLRAIRCFSELLERTPLDPKQTNIAARVVASAARMQTLIDNMLDLARTRIGRGWESNRVPGQRLEPLLLGLISELQASNPERALAVDLHLDAPVNCDPGQISQLFSNLLSNAYTYGDPGQPIRIHASSNAEMLEISLANGGRPIPPAGLQRLFEPYFRGAVERREGLGLGLYIAKEIANAHGGKIDVSSNATETRFVFRMPQA